METTHCTLTYIQSNISKSFSSILLTHWKQYDYFFLAGRISILGTLIVIRYKVYSEQHAKAGTIIQHVIYDQLARAGQNT